MIPLKMILGAAALAAAAGDACAQVQPRPVSIRWNGGAWTPLTKGDPQLVETGVTVTDGGPCLAVSNGDMDNPIEKISGTLTVREPDLDVKTYDVEVDFGAQQVVPSGRARKITVNTPLKVSVRDYLLSGGPDITTWSDALLLSIDSLAPDLYDDNGTPFDIDDDVVNDPDSTGSAWNVADRCPMFVAMLELERRGIPPSSAQIAEMNEYVTQVSRRGNYHWWSSAGLAMLTTDEMEANDWICHGGYRNTAGGGFRLINGGTSTLYSSEIPPGVDGLWRQGIMLSSPQHWTMTQECLIALFTNDLIARRQVETQIESMMSIFPKENYRGQSRSFGWSLDVMAWASACVAPLSPGMDARIEGHLDRILDKLEGYNLIGGPRNSLWSNVGPAVTPKPWLESWAFVNEGFTPQEVADRSEGYNTFQMGILITGLERLLDLGDLPLPLLQRVNTQLDIAAAALLVEGNYDPCVAEEEILSGGFEFPTAVGLGGAYSPYVKADNGGNSAKGVHPRFLLPALYHLEDRYPNYATLIDATQARVIDATDYFNGPANQPGKLMEWMWAPWGAGDTDYGEP